MRQVSASARTTFNMTAPRRKGTDRLSGEKGMEGANLEMLHEKSAATPIMNAMAA